MDLNRLRQQTENSKKAIQEMNRLNKTFGDILQEALRKAPEEHKKSIEEINILSKKITSLAKDGKSEEAKELLKNYQDGSKNNK